MRFTVVVVLAAVAAAVVCAQATNEEAGQAPANPMLPVIMRVQQEEMMARKYTETILKLQHAQHGSFAGMAFAQLLALEMGENKNAPAKESTKASSNDDDDFIALLQRDLEEDDDEDDDANTLFGENTNDGWGFDKSTNKKQVQQELMGSYHLFTATKIKFLQTLYHAADVQREFWMDRVIQLQVQGVASQLPAPLLQLLYMKMYRTQLATLKLSLTLQMISHFTTWLEDAIDVFGALADDSNTNSAIVAQDQGDDMIQDKLWAFTAYNSYALTNFQIFYIDMYLEGAAQQAMQPAPAPAPAPAAAQPASFLEEESQAQPNQFLPMMASNPMMLMRYYKMMFLMFELNSAHAALTSVHAESLAYNKENDNISENDKEAADYRKFAQQMYASFGSNLAYASQIEYITATFDLYSFYAPMMGGMQQMQHA